MGGDLPGFLEKVIGITMEVAVYNTSRLLANRSSKPTWNTMPAKGGLQFVLSRIAQ